jgi:hypothetical protein
MFPLAPNISIKYTAHTAYRSKGVGKKGPGFETDYLQYEVPSVYITIPSTFLQGEIYIQLLLIKKCQIWRDVGTLKIEICLSYLIFK